MDEPWWITELQASRDNHVAKDHVHVDQVFVAGSESTEPLSEPEHPFGWWRLEDLLQSEVVFEDTKVLARQLFGRIEELAGPPVCVSGSIPGRESPQQTVLRAGCD